MSGSGGIGEGGRSGIHHRQKHHTVGGSAGGGSGGNSKNHEDLSDYYNWDVERLGMYFRRRGLDAKYCDILRHHKINGKLAPLLQAEDLKEMGITIVGDRLTFQHAIKDLHRQSRFVKRIESLWEDTEQIFFNPYDQAIFTMCGLCPVDPSTYKLTQNHLKVKKVIPTRCGPFRLCCFGNINRSNNIDLSKVDDVDVIGIPAPCIQRTCCCYTSGKDIVEVESRFEKGNKIHLTLPEGYGETVATLILNQVEESQKMERS